MRLRDASLDFTGPGYRRVGQSVLLEPAMLQDRYRATARFVCELLTATATRAPRYSCCGLHEWAMVYRRAPAQRDRVGRTARLDPAAIERLIASLSRLLDPATVSATTAGTTTAGPELTLQESRPMGGTHVLDGRWRRLGIDTVMAKLLVGRRLDPRVERVRSATTRATARWTG